MRPRRLGAEGGRGTIQIYASKKKIRTLRAIFARKTKMAKSFFPRSRSIGRPCAQLLFGTYMCVCFVCAAASATSAADDDDESTTSPANEAG